jgi:monofunctional glycosyltransferase
MKRPAWTRSSGARHIGRALALLVLSALSLQLVFALRIAAMVALDPASTSFQRSEAWRLVVEQQRLPWAQQWQPRERISPALQRAVIASEDGGFLDHPGVDWDAIQRAWQRNERAEARADRARERRGRPVVPKIVGGSTITQQLAKNLFLSGERTVLRKAQELVLALLLEALLGKERILEIYLNSVEWGEGVFGAEAAARHYFRVGADRLSPAQAARLAVMLPAPKRFEKRPDSPYLLARSATIQARMNDAVLPE